MGTRWLSVVLLLIAGLAPGCASCPAGKDCGNPLLELVLWKHWKHSCRKGAWEVYKTSKREARYRRDLAIHEAKTKYRQAKKEAKDRHEQDLANAKSRRKEAFEQCKWGVLLGDEEPDEAADETESGDEQEAEEAESGQDEPESQPADGGAP